jgi:hypothetical protein
VAPLFRLQRNATRRQLLRSLTGAGIGGAAIGSGILRPAASRAAVDYIDLTSDQTVNGVKTFILAPVVPVGAFPQAAVADLVAHLANKLDRSTPQTVPSAFSLTHSQGGTLSQPENVRPIAFQPRDPAKGMFMLRLYGGQVSSTWDSIFAIGYNSDASRVGEPSLELCIEQDYEPAPGVHHMEMYWQYAPGDRSTFLRPFFVSIDRSTHAITTVISATSLIQFQQADEESTKWMTVGSQGVTMPLPGQGVHFFEHGRINFNSAVGTCVFNTGASPRTLYYRANAHVFQNTAGTPVLQIAAASAPVSTLIAPGNGSTISVVRQAAGIQFFSMQEWQTASSTVLAKINKNGYFVTRLTKPPADTDLLPGEATFFLKDTVSAVGIQWKGKDSTGTVFSLDFSRQPGQPDTTGASLAVLESEVNGLKARLRIMGVMADG